MARPISAIFKFQGTFQGVTYVNSLKYGLHVRAPKGTYTPIVLTDALKKSQSLFQQCNKQAKPIFDALRTEYYGRDLWQRLVSLFYIELKAGRKITVECLRDLECNLAYKLDDLLSNDYHIAVKREKKKLKIGVQLQHHPKAESKAPRVGYQLRLVIVYPDFEKGSFCKDVVMGPMTKYNSVLKTVELEVPMPSAKAPYIILMGVSPVVRGKQFTIQSDTAVKVVAVV